MTTLLPTFVPFLAIESERCETRSRIRPVSDVGPRRVRTGEGGDAACRSFVEQMQQGAATLRSDGTITYANHRLAELLDIPREKLIGAALDDFIAAADYAAYDRLLSRGQFRSVSGEARLQRASGELLPACLTFTALPDDSEVILGVLVTDLTAKRQQERVASSRARHVQAEEALRKSVAEQSDVDRHKNEFLATVAHELRNALAPIRNMLYVLRLTHDDAVAPATTMMERQVNQMGRLIDDLLDLSRMSRGALELRLERVDLALIVQQVVEAARPMTLRSRQQLTWRVPSGPLYVNADSRRLAQVLDNLLSNASKFTDTGGRIHLGFEREGDQAVIRVQDTGIGIAADQLPHIFDMFMQVERSGERSKSGLGIGLTLVKRLVESHGGTVEVRSAGVGQGSEFVVRLPIAIERGNGPPVRAA